MSSPPYRQGSTGARQYRLQKRQKPCDRCRERKLKCQNNGEPPCLRCERDKAACTYVGRPRKRANTSARELVGYEQPTLQSTTHAEDGQELANPLLRACTTVEDNAAEIKISTPSKILVQTSRVSPPPSFIDSGASLGQHTTQLSHSLDHIDGYTAQLFGGSSESDPWLLRHCRFDEFGLRTFHKAHFRNPGGVPTKDKIPIHFIISADELAESAVAETCVSPERDYRAELNALIPPEYGLRLVRLFHKHIFIILPVISRSQLGLTGDDDLPSLHTLSSTPVYLLAAIYASALPYSLSDEQLAPLHAYDKVPVGRIWRLVYDLLQGEIHRPRLSVLQAAVLYLHKRIDDERQLASSDTPFLWSFLGCVIGLTHSLGLHIECSMFGIPAREKRLRRRLWWAIYIEDKMLSLLMGRPPYIRTSEWDVSELRDSDFDVYARSYFDTSVVKNGVPFRDLARLATIAETIQESMYSLRACQRLSENLPASVQAAKPLFDKLNSWRSSISLSGSFSAEKNLVPDTCHKYPKSIYFAYLTLVVYVWRGLLRPTVRSLPPPQIIDPDQVEQPLQDTTFFFEDFSFDFSDLPEIELNIDDRTADTSATIKELHQAAQVCAGNLVAFTRQLSSSDFAEFWQSWSRLSFAVVSNFLMVLFVQSPSYENAVKAKHMLQTWRQVLRDQSRAFSLLLLAMTRLNSFYWAGLSETFCLPPHVEAILP